MQHTALPGRDATGRTSDRGYLFGRECGFFHFGNMLLQLVALQLSCLLTYGGVILERSNSARLSRFAQVIGRGGCSFPPAQNGSCIKLSSEYL
jgi:hypothetical protein